MGIILNLRRLLCHLSRILFLWESALSVVSYISALKFGTSPILLPKWVLNWGGYECSLDHRLHAGTNFPTRAVLFHLMSEFFFHTKELRANCELLLSSFCQTLNTDILHSLTNTRCGSPPLSRSDAQLHVQWGTQEFLRLLQGCVATAKAKEALISIQRHLPPGLRILALQCPTTLLTPPPSQGLSERDWFLQS